VTLVVSSKHNTTQLAVESTEQLNCCCCYCQCEIARMRKQAVFQTAKFEIEFDNVVIQRLWIKVRGWIVRFRQHPAAAGHGLPSFKTHINMLKRKNSLDNLSSIGTRFIPKRTIIEFGFLIDSFFSKNKIDWRHRG